MSIQRKVWIADRRNSEGEEARKRLEASRPTRSREKEEID